MKKDMEDMTIKELEQEIEEQRELLLSLVGWLYPPIVMAKINSLDRRIEYLEHKEN